MTSIIITNYPKNIETHVATVALNVARSMQLLAAEILDAVAWAIADAAHRLLTYWEIVEGHNQDLHTPNARFSNRDHHD